MKPRANILRTREPIGGNAADTRELLPLDVMRRVLQDRLGGAILVGRAGSGRRAAFVSAVDSVDPRPTIIHLNGSPFAAQTRYGVLSLMLSRLEATPSVSRHQLVRAIAALIGEQRTVVTLANPDLIDPDSAAVLAQLATMRKISLVVMCERPSKLPADLSALQRSGVLVRIDVPGMNVGRTRSFLEAELAGPVSMFAAAVVWRFCGANRPLMRHVAREFVSQGRLRVEGGSWIFVPGPFHSPASIRVPQLVSASGDERRLLLLLAHAGPARMSALRHCGLAEEVTSLRSRGLVTVDESSSQSVDIAVPLVAHILRERADENELADVADTLSQVHTDPAAARVLTEARACRDLGDNAAAVSVVEAFEHSGGFSVDAWAADPTTRGLILEVEFRALLMLGRQVDIDTCVTRAGEALATAMRTGARERTHVQAKQLVGLLAAHAAALSGRPGDVVGLTDELWETESLHLKASAIQAEAWSLQNRQREALAIADSVKTTISTLRLGGVLDEVMTRSECVDIECTLLRVRLLAGDWRAAGTAASRLAAGRYPVPHAIAFGDFTSGVLRALAHETDDALGILLPATHQLTATFDGAAPAGLRAAAAFCLADRGQRLEADRLARSRIDPRLASTDFFGWAGAILDCLRRGRDDSDSAIVDLVELAQHCRRRGNETLEMGALAAALRLGDASAADRLGQLSATSSAPAAEGYGLLARAVARGDGYALAEGLERLIRCGQYLYSHGQGSTLAERIGRQDQRRLLATTYVDTSGGKPAESEPAPARQPWLARLTKREAQIATQAITGMTNTAIARVNGVSVRTVEGHLYQVYSKLHVRNRHELAALARPSRTAGQS
ncbi:LuxR C-terminal-related transcriptional regulator [Flaviflexus huanghaiensis]|uniref:LuxR C-terminal-related transcriptional regulator n=1 Tax=Flaviflexus huanghaiensis TaxID=1111473 RepID=UPI0015FC6206